MASKPVPFAGEIGADEGEKIAWVDELYKQADQSRREAEKQWLVNIPLLAGQYYQAAVRDVQLLARRALPVVGTDAGVTANLIAALTRMAAASFVDNLARQVALPATSDQDDVEAAELATDYLDGRMYVDRERGLRLDETMWAMTCGVVFRYTFYDADAEGLTELGPVQGLGDVKTMTLNPWRVHICPWSSSAEDQPFVIVSDSRDIAEVKELYGKDVQPEEIAEWAGRLDSLLVDVVTGRVGSPPRRKDAVILKRMYCRPSKSFPAGRVFTWASGELLQETDLPEGRIPVVRQDWFPIPGRGYSLAFITPLVSLQREINVTLSHIREMRERQSRLDQVIVGPPDVLITEEHAKRELGVDDMGRPRYEETPQKIIRIPPTVTDWKFLDYDAHITEAEIYLQRLWSLMQECAGVHAPTLGGPMPSGAPALMAQLQKDSDLTGFAMTRHGFDWGNCQIAPLKLVIARNHYDVPRMLRVVGEKNAVKTRSFFGSELRDTEDVRPKCVPPVSETMRMQLRRENAANFDLSGPAQIKLAKCELLLSSGIPGIEEDVEALLAPYSVEDLRKICAGINRIEIQTSAVQAMALLNQATMAVQGQEQMAQAAQESEMTPESPPPAQEPAGNPAIGGGGIG